MRVVFIFLLMLAMLHVCEFIFVFRPTFLLDGSKDDESETQAANNSRNFSNALPLSAEILGISSPKGSKVQLANASDLPINDLITWENKLSEPVLPKNSSKDDAVMEKIWTDDIINEKTVSEDILRLQRKTFTKGPPFSETRKNIDVLSPDLWEP